MSNLKILTIDQLMQLADWLEGYNNAGYVRVMTELADRESLDKAITDELNNPPKDIMK